MERALTGLKGLASRKSVKDLAGLLPKEYPTDASQYELLEDCGRGVSATVHRAYCKPLGEIVAVKKMNLESVNCDLDEIIHEAQIMRAYNHPNVLPLYCSFVDGQDLWMVMPFISGGSVLHIMKYAHPEGLDEVCIATITRDVLKALEYVHRQGGIHRDIKAGNILIDKDGCVKLGDFGVAATLDRGGSWGHDKATRMTFVGTPCWMAPEVMEQSDEGYGCAADIWSVGITMLEMAHGHAPFAKYPPMKVLLMTLQNPPPTLDDKGKKHFSKAMRDVVSRCLQKDPRLRPTATQLLEHKFFKQARDNEFLARTIISGLPSLGDRVQEIRQGRAATTASENDKNFARSQEEYKKGVSSWNFDVAALKAQADLEPDEDSTPSLPTITETEEKDDMTFTRLAATATKAALLLNQTTPPQPSQSVSMQQPVLQPQHPQLSPLSSSWTSLQQQQQQQQQQSSPSSANGTAATPVSVFATPSGQAPTLQSTPLSAIPVPIPGSPPAHIVAPEVVLAVETPLEAKVDSTPLSPGALSPPNGMSREGSTQGPLSSLTTPSATRQKKQGRFQIYESGEEPPPMSPPAPRELESLNSSRNFSTDFASARPSEDGTRRDDKVAEGTDETVNVEPKKKGRFMIIEGSSSMGAKNPSMANLAEVSSRTRSEPAARDLTGRPPQAPGSSSSGGGSILSTAQVLPKLQELLDHAAQHHLALQKLVAAVQDGDKSKASSFLSRSQSTKSLFERAPMGSLSSAGAAAHSEASSILRERPAADSTAPGAGLPTGGESVEELRQVVDVLRIRLTDVEGDNVRLRTRNHQLEMLLGGSASLGSEGVSMLGAPPAMSGASPNTISPRDTRSATPRVSDDDVVGA